MEREITKNEDGTFKVIESSVVESVTRENLGIFRDKLQADIERLTNSIADLEKQKADVDKFLKE